VFLTLFEDDFGSVQTGEYETRKTAIITEFETPF